MAKRYKKIVKRYKKIVKRKIIYKLQPIHTFNLMHHSKKSFNKAVLISYKKKFKPFFKRKKKFIKKKFIKKKIWMTWSFKKRNIFRKFAKIDRIYFANKAKNLQKKQLYLINKTKMGPKKHLHFPIKTKILSKNQLQISKIKYFTLLINIQTSLSINSILSYLLPYKIKIIHTPSIIKVNMAIFSHTVSLIMKNKKRQYIKKIILNKYAWYQDTRFIKLKIMRKRLRRLTNKFRKIKKNTAFNTLIRRQFFTLTGLSFNLFQIAWNKIRRTNRQYWGTNQLVSLFSTSLLLTPSNLLFLLGFVNSISAGTALIKSGNLFYNGKTCTIFLSLKPGDILQIVQSTITIVNNLYSIHSNRFNNKLLFYLPFLHVDTSLMLILLIRWPYTFELVSPSFISSRWVRYYIRQISVKNKHNKYSMTNLFNLILILPIFSFLIICIFGHKLGTYGSMLISVSNMLAAWLFSLILFFNISFNSIFYIALYNWLSISGFDVSFCFRYDSLTSIMFIVVTTVSSCVHIYSCVYMYTDAYLSRFMSYLSLFTFFMLLLVSSSNLLVLFLGWEGVGLCSYLLIGFWYTRAQAGKAATKAFLINKIGDLFFLTGISVALVLFHTLEFSTITALVSLYPNNLIEIITLFLFLGAVGKSAQIGLHTWLPDAMEGPTPVSALIHAATMVTAGVFLVIRCSFLFEYTPRVLMLIAVWGGITALISGLIGTVQNDIKKIIAYSTCSQLGYMILGCGLSLYNLGLFHLFNHAFFKALLFLSAGSIIHILNNEQDIRKMGGLAKLSPFVYINMVIASLALAGFPFLAGFYSKDLIIESSMTKYWLSNQILFWLAITSAILTAIYSFRLLEQVFWNDYNGYKNVISHHAKLTNIEIIILGFLGILSLSSGYIFKDIFSGFGSLYFNNSIIYLPTFWTAVELEFLPIELKILPLMLTILAFEIESRFFECKWFYNEIVNGYLALPTLIMSRHYFEQYEKLNLEYNGPLFLTFHINNLSQKSI